jgi:hypothetical protein
MRKELESKTTYWCQVKQEIIKDSDGCDRYEPRLFYETIISSTCYSCIYRSVSEMTHRPILPLYKGFTCQHHACDQEGIKDLLGIYKPKWIIELGTFQGGLTALLADTCKRWNGEVLTFDFYKTVQLKRFAVINELLGKFDNIKFVNEDILIEPNPKAIEWIKKPKSLVYCDNGNKQKEIEIYASYVIKGGILGTHDWKYEVDPEKTFEVLNPLGFKEIGEGLFENGRSKFWIKE